MTAVYVALDPCTVFALHIHRVFIDILRIQPMEVFIIIVIGRHPEIFE
jgi:hypothetical protein